MYVNIESAKVDAALAETFGRPEFMDPEFQEVYLYHLDSKPTYWRHSPDAKAWDVLHPRPGGENNLQMPGILDEEERESLTQALARLAWFPAPELPGNLDKKVIMPRFAFDGWLFAWVFFPELSRWELAPRGRK